MSDEVKLSPNRCAMSVLLYSKRVKPSKFITTQSDSSPSCASTSIKTTTSQQRLERSDVLQL